MTLIDTSVWIDHFAGKNQRLISLLADCLVVCHPLVIGELACGNLQQRNETFRALRELPLATVARDEEVMHCLEAHKLWGTGIGWIDAHLLTSALLTHCRLWSLDRKLQKTAAAVGVAA